METVNKLALRMSVLTLSAVISQLDGISATAAVNERLSLHEIHHELITSRAKLYNMLDSQ
jgi:hypothetical protein